MNIRNNYTTMPGYFLVKIFNMHLNEIIEVKKINVSTVPVNVGRWKHHGNTGW